MFTFGAYVILILYPHTGTHAVRFRLIYIMYISILQSVRQPLTRYMTQSIKHELYLPGKIGPQNGD